MKCVMFCHVMSYLCMLLYAIVCYRYLRSFRAATAAVTVIGKYFHGATPAVTVIANQFLRENGLHVIIIARMVPPRDTRRNLAGATLPRDRLLTMNRQESSVLTFVPVLTITMYSSCDVGSQGSQQTSNMFFPQHS